MDFANCLAKASDCTGMRARWEILLLPWVLISLWNQHWVAGISTCLCHWHSMLVVPSLAQKIRTAQKYHVSFFVVCENYSKQRNWVMWTCLKPWSFLVESGFKLYHEVTKWACFQGLGYTTMPVSTIYSFYPALATWTGWQQRTWIIGLWVIPSGLLGQQAWLPSSGFFKKSNPINSEKVKDQRGLFVSLLLQSPPQEVSFLILFYLRNMP